MSSYVPGDIVLMRNVEPEPVIVTVIRKVPHPILSFRTSYEVLSAAGKVHSISEAFLWSIP